MIILCNTFRGILIESYQKALDSRMHTKQDQQQSFPFSNGGPASANLKETPMKKETIVEILIWLLGVVFVAIAAILIRVEMWLLVRSVKRAVSARKHANKNTCRPECISDPLG